MTPLSPTHIVQDLVVRLLRLVLGDDRFRVCKVPWVGRKYISRAMEGQKGQFRGPLQSLEASRCRWSSARNKATKRRERRLSPFLDPRWL